MIDPLILGDNAFFGVNHRSQADGAQKAVMLQDPKNVIRLLRAAKASGAGGVMLSSHERSPGIVKEMLKDPSLRNDFAVYPNIPYLLKYVSQVTRHGMAGTLLRVLAGQSGLATLRHMTLGSLGLMQKDFYQWIRIGVDVEMNLYKGARVPAIFLHNGIVDLLLGLELKDPLLFYDAYIRERYGAEPGYGTLNLAKLAGFLVKIGLKDPLVMAPFNASGFHMNPSPRVSEEAAKAGGFTLLAMNVLSSGSGDPKKAFEYLSHFPKIQHVIIGASTEEHIAESFRLAAKWIRPGAGL